MIKFIVTISHLSQLIIHSWFMYQCVLTFYSGIIVETLWNQVKYLTNFSNWAMFTFLIPFVIFDFKNYNVLRIQDRYPQIVTLLFQGINPIIFLVMATYQSFIILDPNLLVLDGFHPTQWQLVILAYLHLGNWLLLQIEYILYEHKRVPKLQRYGFFFAYTFIYLFIYGCYFLLRGKHVYGFQKNLSIPLVFMININQFLMILFTDYAYEKVTRSKFFKKFILENYQINNQTKNEKQNQ
ncbi:unnamed protein product (macronuclear) [Paramecium tetraurelia]|uniref:Transmembrane protein n=1 Tax=Paramecium tetraurelia TaxID=5888 RepID=A0DFT6_PARTE|nr:uncharacterized protein GSPATT00016716001 [Paramecium tetraurelia]CAK81903.1 unnamed protein product [Paramecium tetraurelia]|eukprot:XP_001449300.1 hypothetical protein (macronuclear) [Paramecium tetraurelia strain d4-2]